METLTLKNRKDQTIVGDLDIPSGDIRGVCVVFFSVTYRIILYIIYGAGLGK